MQDHEIPLPVMERAENLTREGDVQIVHLGENADGDFYSLKFPVGTITGFPIVYAYNRETGQVRGIYGFEALDILGLF